MSKSRSLLKAIRFPAWRGGKAFARDQRGTTAIEFGLLAIPFFALVGATLETGLVSLAGQILDSAVQDSSRLIRTGQAQTANYNAALFEDAICDGLYGMFTCNELRVRVTVMVDFATAMAASPVVASGPNAGQWSIVEDYDDGVRDSIILVEAHYKWPVILNIGGFTLEDQPGGMRLLSAVRVFRNEPF